MKGKLKEHLLTVQEQAEQRMELLTGQMMKQEGVTEKLKAENQMLWVQKMNSIRHTAEEIVLREQVYSLKVKKRLKKLKIKIYQSRTVENHCPVFLCPK